MSWTSMAPWTCQGGQGEVHESSTLHWELQTTEDCWEWERGSALAANWLSRTKQPENIHKRNIVQAEQVKFRNICTYALCYMELLGILWALKTYMLAITINERKHHECEEERGGGGRHMKKVWRRKGSVRVCICSAQGMALLEGVARLE